MIKIRNNIFSNNEISFPRVDNESLQDSIDRYISEYESSRPEIKAYYTIHVNGIKIESAYWRHVKPKEKTNVLFVLNPKSGNTEQNINQIAPIVAAIAVLAIPAVAAASPWVGALAATGAALATSLAAQKLFPINNVNPTNIDVTTPTSPNFSQMYSISGQSNSVRQYGNVPKVYGNHRIFPNIVGNAYTQLEGDDSDVAYYLYAIYDLGYGPLYVDDVFIGETNINDYNDVSINLVDLNKPGVNGGEWDRELNAFKKFNFYKGDNFQQNVGVNLNKDQGKSFGADVSEYQATRTGASNPDGVAQEIFLDFSTPSGLISYDSAGNTAERSIEIQVQFREVGETIWRAFNDYRFIDNYRVAGGVSINFDDVEFAFQNRTVNTDRYFLISPYYSVRSVLMTRSEVRKYTDWAVDDGGTFYQDQYRLKTGQKYFYSSTFMAVGTVIYRLGSIIGAVDSRSGAAYGVDYEGKSIYRYKLDRDITYGQLVFRDFTRTVGQITWESHYVDVLGNGRPPYYGSTFKGSGNNSGIITITNENPNFQLYGVSFIPKTTAQIEVQVTRIRAIGGLPYSQRDDFTWLNFNTRLDKVPIITKERHVFLELRIRATDQLNGSIQNLNANVRSVLDVYNPSTQQWEKQDTNNPAWIFADILTGAINRNAVPKSKLDTDSLVAWANYCDEIPPNHPGGPYYEKRYTCNFVLDFATTVSNLIQNVCSSADANMALIGGKYGVLIDKLVTTPVQVITPRNSWGFSSSKSYYELPHAIKVGYVDAESEWNIKQEIVYNDGYNINNATKFEDYPTFGCTNVEQAFRFGRKALAEAKLRREVFTVEMDFENLVAERGDYVILQYDVMKVGARAARVSNVSGSTITIDDEFVIDVGPSYGYSFRSSSNGVIYQGGTLSNFTVDTAQVTGTIPSIGDLLIWGEVGSISVDCIVKAIVPGDDLTAQLTLIEKADAIHSAESGAALPAYSPLISTSIDTITTAPPEVLNLSIDANTYRDGGGDYEYYITTGWDAPAGAVVDTYEVYVDYGNGYEFLAFTNNLFYEYIVRLNNIGVAHNFKIIAVSNTGNKLSLGSVGFVSATPVSKSTPPSDVEALYINILNEQVELEWTNITDFDINYYLLRYSPNLSATWESSIPLQKVGKNTNKVSFQARVGSYFVKAFDWNGNESVIAAAAVTSIPSLTNINIVETIDDFPTLPGTIDQVEVSGSTLRIAEKTGGDPENTEYYSYGYYYYESLLDLGEIYTVRLQSLIEAEGYNKNDLMSSWDLLANVTLLSQTLVSDWDVEAYARGTNIINVISAWATLSSVSAMVTGAAENWTEWRKITIGDMTARAMQFRLKLISNKTSVSPSVFSGSIQADMPDRVENYDNQVTSGGSLAIVFNPPFAGPGTTPNIQITQDAMQNGDNFTLTNRTLSGFTINFFDSLGSPVDRQFDALVKGYGRKNNNVI